MLKRYIIRRIKSFRYAFQGLATLLRTQPNAVLHLIASIIVICLGFYFEVSHMEWVALAIAMALVWITEAINTCIEFLVDIVSPDFNPLAGKIKDVAATAVLLAALFSIAVGLIIFIPKVF